MEGDHWVAAPSGSKQIAEDFDDSNFVKIDADAERERQCIQRQQLLMPYTSCESFSYTN